MDSPAGLVLCVYIFSFTHTYIYTHRVNNYTKGLLHYPIMEEVFVKGKQKDDEEKNMSSHTTSDVIIDCHTKEEEKEVAPTIVEEAQLRQKTKRVATLDAFRGLTIVVSSTAKRIKL